MCRPPYRKSGYDSVFLEQILAVEFVLQVQRNMTDMEGFRPCIRLKSNDEKVVPCLQHY